MALGANRIDGRQRNWLMSLDRRRQLVSHQRHATGRRRGNESDEFLEVAIRWWSRLATTGIYSEIHRGQRGERQKEHTLFP